MNGHKLLKKLIHMYDLGCRQKAHREYVSKMRHLFFNSTFIITDRSIFDGCGISVRNWEVRERRIIRAAKIAVETATRYDRSEVESFETLG